MDFTKLIDSLGIKEYRDIQGITISCIFVLIYTAEHFSPQRKDIIDYKHELFNFSIGVINQLLVFVVGLGFYYVLILSYDYQIGLLHLINIPIVVKYIIGFILVDCWMYWWHRFNHKIHFLWYFHQFHHKDTKLNSTSALRFHIGELLLSFIPRAILFGLLGTDPLLIIIYSTVLFFVIVLHHSNLKISEKADFALRKLIVSPRMHRIHHSVIRSETNSNYSSVFPYWDMIFRTYNKKPVGPIQFGIESNMEQNDIEIINKYGN